MSLNVLHSDKELLHRVAAGDELAFKELSLRYTEKVFFHALTFVKTWQQAEEIVQDIFLKIWQGREKLLEVEQFDNYLFIISKNYLISAIRKKVRDTAEAAVADEVEEVLYRPDSQYETRELRALLEKGINQLPEQKRAVFRLIHQEGLSQEEVSQRLGIATRTVRWNLVEAMNGLKDFLHRHAAGGEYYLLLFVLLTASAGFPI